MEFVTDISVMNHRGLLIAFSRFSPTLFGVCVGFEMFHFLWGGFLRRVEITGDLVGSVNDSRLKDVKRRATGQSPTGKSVAPPPTTQGTDGDGTRLSCARTTQKISFSSFSVEEFFGVLHS